VGGEPAIWPGLGGIESRDTGRHFSTAAPHHGSEGLPAPTQHHRFRCPPVVAYVRAAAGRRLKPFVGVSSLIAPA